MGVTAICALPIIVFCGFLKSSYSDRLSFNYCGFLISLCLVGERPGSLPWTLVWTWGSILAFVVSMAGGPSLMFPLIAAHREIQADHPKETHPGRSLAGLKLKLLRFGHLVRRAKSSEKSLLLGNTEGRRRGQ